MVAKSLLLSLGTSLLLTELTELAVAFLLGVRAWRDFLLVLLVNVVTNPAVGLFFDGIWLYTGRSPAWYLLLAGELAVFAVEALLYRNRLVYRKLPAWALSLVLNSASYLGGVLLATAVSAGSP